MSRFDSDTNGFSKVLFCSSIENVPSCLAFLNRQLQAFGLRSSCKLQGGDHPEEADIPALLNIIYELIVIHQQDSKLRETNEGIRMRQNADLTHLQQTRAKLRDEVEQLKREKQQIVERERQANERCKLMREELSKTTQELDRLRKESTTRSESYQHEQRRAEREMNRIKARVSELSSGSGTSGQSTLTAGISLTNLVGFRRSDDGAVTSGRRRWCTAERSEHDFLKQLVAQQDDANRALLVENTQLKRTLTKLVFTTNRLANKLSIRLSTSDSAEPAGSLLDTDLNDLITDGPESSAGLDGTVNSASHSDLPTDILLSQLESEWKAACRTLCSLPEQRNASRSGKAPAAANNHEVEELRSKLTEYEQVLRAHEQLVRAGLAKLNISTGSLQTGSSGAMLDVPTGNARRSLSLHTTPTKASPQSNSAASEHSSPNSKIIAAECQSSLQVRADTLKRQLLELVLDENANDQPVEVDGVSQSEKR